MNVGTYTKIVDFLCILNYKKIHVLLMSKSIIKLKFSLLVCDRFRHLHDYCLTAAFY